MLLVTEHDELLPSATAAQARATTAQARLDALTERTERTVGVFIMNKSAVARESEALQRYVHRADSIAGDIRTELRVARGSSQLDRQAHTDTRAELARATCSARRCIRLGRKLRVSLAAVAAGEDPGAIARAHTPPPATQSRAVLSRRRHATVEKGQEDERQRQRHLR